MKTARPLEKVSRRWSRRKRWKQYGHNCFSFAIDVDERELNSIMSKLGSNAAPRQFLPRNSLSHTMLGRNKHEYTLEYQLLHMGLEKVDEEKAFELARAGHRVIHAMYGYSDFHFTVVLPKVKKKQRYVEMMHYNGPVKFLTQEEYWRHQIWMDSRYKFDAGTYIVPPNRRRHDELEKPIEYSAKSRLLMTDHICTWLEEMPDVGRCEAEAEMRSIGVSDKEAKRRAACYRYIKHKHLRRAKLA